MFSYSLEMEDGRIVPLVQYVASLAFTEAIKDLCDKNVMFLFILLCVENMFTFHPCRLLYDTRV